ncbi:MAG: hypothetical protein VX523_00550 [Chloroflexota bacterium]|jgi:hypothetical protein|nr:hypothetical protein [Chloroflexota bacterium]
MNNFFFLHGAVGYLDEVLFFFIIPPLLIIVFSAWRRGTKRKNRMKSRNPKK